MPQAECKCAEQELQEVHEVHEAAVKQPKFHVVTEILLDIKTDIQAFAKQLFLAKRLRIHWARTPPLNMNMKPPSSIKNFTSKRKFSWMSRRDIQKATKQLVLAYRLRNHWTSTPSMNMNMSMKPPLSIKISRRNGNSARLQMQNPEGINALATQPLN